MRRLLLSILLLTAAAAGSTPTAVVAAGKLQGRPHNSGAVFKGIPYAQPPVGTLRWHAPMPVTHWNGVRDAGEFGAPCPQIPQGWNDSTAAAAKEDCLHLNIWTDKWPPKTLLPVMFWVHGGGNTSGSGSSGLFDGELLTRHGVVFVSIEYRLGALGFLAHPELTAESPYHASGNYGLLDQIAALTWVKENIAKFGGDPENVTIFGQSAGAQDLGLLMTSPLAKGLFRRALAESGTVIIDGRMTEPLAQAHQAGQKFAAGLHAPASGTIGFLRGLLVEEILKATLPDQAGAPNVDGWVLPRAPLAVYLAGEEQHIPMLIGNNGRERSFNGTPEILAKLIQHRFGPLAPEALKLYGLEGDSPAAAYPPYGSAGDQFVTDTSFRCTAVAIAGWHSAAGNAVYQYEFTRGEKGAAHSAEHPFVFGRPAADAPKGLQRLADSMHEYWTNFAKTGNPNGAGLPVWPQYDSVRQGYIEFSSEGPVVKSDLRRPFCELFIKSFKAGLPSE